MVRTTSGPNDYGDPTALACAILDFAIRDWKRLIRDEVDASCGQYGLDKRRHDLLYFFNSKWCCFLLESVTEVTWKQMMEAQEIPMRKIKSRSKL